LPVAALTARPAGVVAKIAVNAANRDYTTGRLRLRHMPRPFTVSRSQDGDVSILHLDGFLDAHTAPAFEQAIQAELDAGHPRLVIDATNLTYISSAGLGVLISFISQIRQQGGDLKISALKPRVRQIFEILGFQTIYDVVDSVPAAVQRFNMAPAREA
jgi:anti-sigma B factor antagonist